MSKLNYNRGGRGPGRGMGLVNTGYGFMASKPLGQAGDRVWVFPSGIFPGTYGELLMRRGGYYRMKRLDNGNEFSCTRTAFKILPRE